MGEKKKEGKGMSGAPLVAGVPSAFFSPSLRSFFLFSSPLGDLFSLLSFFLSFSHLRGRAVQWVVESAVCEAARGAPPPSVIEKKKEGRGMSRAPPLAAGVPSAFFSLKLLSLLKPSR